MRSPKGRLELTWMGKDMALIPTAHGKYDYEWVDPTDPRACEVKSIEVVKIVGEATGATGAEQNLLIVGDSGDALRSLSTVPEWAAKYRGKVKLVYIDPPFNTEQVFEHSVINLGGRDGYQEMHVLRADPRSELAEVIYHAAPPLDGLLCPPRLGRTQFSEVALRYRQRGNWRPRTHRTVGERLRYAIAHFGDRPIASIRKDDIQSFVSGLPLAPNTVRVVMQHVSGVFNTALDDGLLGGRNPRDGVVCRESTRLRSTRSRSSRSTRSSPRRPSHSRRPS
ncbi:MAG: hypothetical protein LH616_17815 [Ilumatobacteraceae bacterium]|nr:hypothetical protein [Ilumatobacteraceae bacterium]